MDWQWDEILHKKRQVGKTGIKKLNDEWVWQPVKLSSGGQYGSHQIGELLEEGMYRCAFCQGLGEKPKGSRCSVCKGIGTVSVDSPAVRCAYCKGRGEERPRSNVTCTACRGKGVIHVEEPVEICLHCRGTGKELTNKLICIKCRGKGVVTVKEEAAIVNYADKMTADYADESAASTVAREEPVGSASGSEREALEVVKKLGEADRVAVARNMLPPVSSAYAEQLCNALVKKGFLTRSGILYTFVSSGEKALE